MLYRANIAADLFDHAAVLMSHGRRLPHSIRASIRPEIGPAHTCGGHPNDGIRRLHNRWVAPLFEPRHAAKENSSLRLNLGTEPTTTDIIAAAR